MSNWHARFLGVQGKFTKRCRFPPGIINAQSVVLASVTELKGAPGLAVSPEETHLGDARNMSVNNISPEDNGTLLVVVDTDWNVGPINVRVSFSVDPL